MNKSEEQRARFEQIDAQFQPSGKESESEEKYPTKDEKGARAKQKKKGIAKVFQEGNNRYMVCV